ncbi:hypothetical protein [Tropicimonas isoalkanivorans]|uniref:Secreted protein n=1 Tax=Tropicimonas isoalkanivorans TaxID=441112 RepID=A0A1I1ILT4_9RHOB|nr:hypothetical protein [Tropicimonas isoalkanivorans]SFC35208.1 hypothetical protein SAMN04488094_10476 [Tropicimonas isoalkanivorans]
MKFLTPTVLAAALAASVNVVTAPAADAGSAIERACIRSNRSAATRPLCGCIQGVADQMLTRREQRMAAKFFRDPHRAQEIRQSDDAWHEAFWKRYKAFGTTAGNVCR